MRRRLFQGLSLVNAVAIVILGFLGVPKIYDAFFPIHEIHSVVLLNPEVKPGSPLYYEMTISRREICDPRVYRFIHRLGADGSRTLVDSKTFVGAVGGIGREQRVISSFILPSNLVPGKYETSGFVVNSCKNYQNFSTAIPRTEFTVISGSN